MKELKKLDKKNIRDIFALTPTQEGILFHYLLDPNSDAYFEQLSLELEGIIDMKRFEQTWNFVIETNEMLRTVFRWEGMEESVQVVLREYPFQPVVHDLTDSPPDERKTKLTDTRTADRNNKFDLQQVPFRVTLCKLGENRWEMIISHHHILFDGWSTGIILKEFFKAYSESVKGNRFITPPAKTKFKEFVRWWKEQDTAKQEEFWEEYLAGFKPRGEHPAKRYKKIEITGTGSHRFILPSEVKDKAEAFVRDRGITMASLLYSVWGIVVQHYNCTDDVLFDTTVSGRTAKISGIEDMVGLFINTLPLRVQTNPREKISDFLSRMHRMLQARANFENSSPLAVDRYIHKCDTRLLFDSVVVLENYPLDRILMKPNGPLTAKAFSITEITHYDLTLIITILDDMKINFTYNKDVFAQGSMLGLSHHLSTIFREVLENPGKTIGELGINLCRDNQQRTGNDIKKAAKSTGRGNDAGKIDEMDVTVQELVRIWEEVRGKRPAPDDDFFEIGGNSLELVRIYKQVNARYPGKIKVNDFFANPTIRKLKQLLISKDVHPVENAVKKKIRYIDL